MTTSTLPNPAKILKDKFTKSLGLPCESVLPESQIQEVIDELSIKYKSRLFDPFVTLWTFILQILDFDKTCQNAVSKTIALLSEENVEIPSTDSSAYCQARKRLPEDFFHKLFYKSGENLDNKLEQSQLWCGRNVKVMDCSTVSMPDTVENQNAYPQSTSQSDGCGFPIATIGVIFSLITGAAMALAIDVLNTNDVKLARRLYQFLVPGDVFLGDSAFCSYPDFWLIQKRGCDVVVRKHNGRCKQFNSGCIVKTQDRIVTWHKFKRSSKEFTEQEYSALPDSLQVREISYSIEVPGFRTQFVSLITTLLDEFTFPTSELTQLYKSRWNVEVDLKHLKTSLGMDILRSKTPSMIRKEIYVFLLAYNVLRSLMWTAGNTYTTPPLQLSLQGTRHHLINFLTTFLCVCSYKRYQVFRTLLKVIVHKVVPTRDGRVEPRVKKRRPKAYPLMTKPRALLSKKMITK